MNREFKRDLNNNYMILSDDVLKTMDDYRVRMLISNQIPLILKCSVRKFDGVAKYYYEITSKYSMNRIYDKKKIGRNELNHLVTSFLKVLDSSIEYLLNPNDFILDPEYIYMNIETSQVYFCYMPGYEADISNSFHELTSYILEKIDHEDKHAVATAYELYRQTLNDNYCLRDILNKIIEDGKEMVAAESEELIQEEHRKEYVRAEYKKEEEQKIVKNTIKIKPVYLFGGTVISIALAFFVYYIATHIEEIKKIKIDSDLLLQIGGGALIVIVLIIYIIYKNYQMKKEDEKDEDNLIIISDENELVSRDKELVSKEKKLVAKEKEFVSKDKEFALKKKKGVTKENETIAKDKNQIAITKDNEHNNLVINVKTSPDTYNQSETYGNTVLLAYKPMNRKLIATKEIYSNFEIIGKSFLIGKMEEHVDGVIQDEMVSRIHAEIKKEGNQYFLTDFNSTNGTFHNERRLEANETVEIYAEDMIRFATVEYLFR